MLPRILTLLVFALLTVRVSAQDSDFAPEQDKLPIKPPSDAIVLFDGKGTNHFLSMKGEANIQKPEVRRPNGVGAPNVVSRRLRAHISASRHTR